MEAIYSRSFQILESKSARWDFYKNEAYRQTAVAIISDALAEFYKSGYHDFDSEIAQLYKTIDSSSGVASEQLRNLTPYTLDILRLRPDWEEAWLSHPEKYSDAKLKAELHKFFSLSARRYRPHKDKRWFKLRLSRKRVSKRSVGAQAQYKLSLIIFCNSVCIAHLCAGGLVPQRVQQIIKTEYYDLLNLIDDAFESLQLDIEIEPEKILAATIRWRVKYMKKYRKVSARIT